MADKTEEKNQKAAPEAPAEAAGKKIKKKKTRPTNCAQSNKRIRRKDWYYRDGKYFANKKSFKLFATQEAEKAKKEKDAKAAAAAAAVAAATANEKSGS